MAVARQETEWAHTSSLMAMQANMNRDPKKRRKAYEPWEFMPEDMARKARSEARKRRKSQAIPSDISSMKMFLPKGNR